MAAVTVQEAVQETLIRQFLGGSDPSCRLGAAGAGAQAEGGPRRVEDLAWWRYDRSLAMWHCEWLDAYYDSGDRAFFRRDELTQLFEPADLVELRELASRMRLELPEHDAPPPEEGEGGRAAEEAEAPEAAGGPQDVGEDPEPSLEVVAGGVALPVDADTDDARGAGGAADGGWHDTAAGVDCEEEPQWVPDGRGNLTHWSAAAGRMFLWQEQAGVLYEYLPGDRAGGGAAGGGGSVGARYCALWAAQGPLCALSRADDAQSSRLVDRRGVELGAAPAEEDVGWVVEGEGVLPSHARVFVGSSGCWWVEPAAWNCETLVDGHHVFESRPARLHHGSILRLGAASELRVDLPDWPGAPPRDGGAPAAKGKKASAPAASVLESPFLPREADAPQAPPLTGADRARALNAALRRAICHPTSRERAAAQDLEARYEDQAAKRRRLHPEPSAAEALLLRKAQALAAAFSAGDAAEPEAVEVSEGAERYRQDVAGTMDAAGCFTGSGAERAGLGYRPPVTGAQRLAAARQFSEDGGVWFLVAEGAG